MSFKWLAGAPDSGPVAASDADGDPDAEAKPPRFKSRSKSSSKSSQAAAHRVRSRDDVNQSGFVIQVSEVKNIENVMQASQNQAFENVNQASAASVSDIQATIVSSSDFNRETVALATCGSNTNANFTNLETIADARRIDVGGDGKLEFTWEGG
jgi:hypothetical protein